MTSGFCSLASTLLAFVSLSLSSKRRTIISHWKIPHQKTTILYKLRLGEVITSIPTIGFNVEQVQYKRLNLTVWGLLPFFSFHSFCILKRIFPADVGGQEKIRRLWRYYYQGSDALIFVVDSADHERFCEARDELHSVLADDSLRSIPVLVLANKQDVSRALSVAQVAQELELSKLRTQKWFVQASSAVTGDGLYEGLDWLATALTTRSKSH